MGTHGPLPFPAKEHELVMSCRITWELVTPDSSSGQGFHGSFLPPMAVIGRNYVTPHPTMSTSTGRGAMAVQAPHLFADATSGPRNLLHHDTVLGYGLAASTATTCHHHHHHHDFANAQTKRKARNKEHLRDFSFYFRTSKYYNPTTPFVYYKRGGRDPR
jgi:hypothetical protein